MVTDEHLNLLFHFDGALMTHSYLQIINKHIKILDSECGSNSPLAVARGDVHKNLGMTLDFRIEGSYVLANVMQ